MKNMKKVITMVCGNCGDVQDRGHFKESLMIRAKRRGYDVITKSVYFNLRVPEDMVLIEKCQGCKNQATMRKNRLAAENVA